MRIILFKLKQWYAKAKREYEDSKVQEVQEANEYDLKEWYTSEWEVPELSDEEIDNIVETELNNFIEEEFKEEKPKKSNSKTNKKTKKSTLEDI